MSEIEDIRWLASQGGNFVRLTPSAFRQARDLGLSPDDVKQSLCEMDASVGGSQGEAHYVSTTSPTGGTLRLRVSYYPGPDGQVTVDEVLN